MFPSQSAIRFLASVRSVPEAVNAASHGADIIDCKDPHAGALGALDAVTIAAIRGAVPAHIPVSATVGDDAVSAPDLTKRVARAASAGADFVKIGFEKQVSWQSPLDALMRESCGNCQLVGVLIADRGLDLALINAFSKAGFAGVLLDTADKTAGALPDVVNPLMLSTFVKTAHENGLFAGLAGALRAHHVAGLAAFNPDILGFRGALCHNNGRQNELEPTAVAALRAQIDATQTETSTATKSLEVTPL